MRGRQRSGYDPGTALDAKVGAALKSPERADGRAYRDKIVRYIVDAALRLKVPVSQVSCPDLETWEGEGLPRVISLRIATRTSSSGLSDEEYINKAFESARRFAAEQVAPGSVTAEASASPIPELPAPSQIEIPPQPDAV